MIRMSKTTKNQ